MSTGDRLKHLVTAFALGVCAGAILSPPSMAQSPGPVALAGKVASQEEGAMEGVIVNAKRQGSTIMASVVSNAQGQFSFPKDRLEAGIYDITIRAIGYVLAPTTATISGTGIAQADLSLKKSRPDQLASQMSNSEWMQSAPGTASQKIGLLRCLDCHGLQRPFFSQKNAEEMAISIQRMSAHAPNAAPNFPFFLDSANAMLSRPPSKADVDLGAYIASVNLSRGEGWTYPLKTIPRPTGKATQVIMTTYDLPGVAAPHDTLRDKDGAIWYSDFQQQFMSKLDPRTGEVTQWPIPIQKPGFPTGGLMITVDENGMIWQCMMGQAELARLDPRTGEVKIFLTPDWQKGDTRFTMIDALHSDVDGFLWTKTNNAFFEPGEDTTKVFRVNIETGEMFVVEAPPGRGRLAGYGLVSDLENNVYSLDNNPNQKQIWRTNGKTGDTIYIDVGDSGGRRGHIDSQNRLWFSQFYANRYGMYDPKTGKVTKWDAPVPYAGAYDVQYDDVKYAWGADMSTDLVQRLDPEKGEWTSYLLPLSINTRHIDVQKIDNPYGVSSMWTAGQQNGKIVHIEPYGS